MHVTVTDTNSLGQSGPGSNGYEWVLFTFQIFRAGASSSDAAKFYTQDIIFLKEYSHSSAWDTVYCKFHWQGDVVS